MAWTDQYRNPLAVGDLVIVSAYGEGARLADVGTIARVVAFRRTRLALQPVSVLSIGGRYAVAERPPIVAAPSVITKLDADGKALHPWHTGSASYVG